MERLRHVGRALGAAPAAAVAPAEEELPALRQHDDGRLLDEDLELLRQQELAAAAAQDYRRAAHLHDIHEALRPQRRLTLAECAPTDVDAQHAFFLENGFLLIHNILPPDKIPRAQAAWTAAQERARDAWEARKAAGEMELSTTLYYDLPNLLAEDDVFIDMVDSPALVPVMSRSATHPRTTVWSRSLKNSAHDFLQDHGQRDRHGPREHRRRRGVHGLHACRGDGRAGRAERERHQRLHHLVTNHRPGLLVAPSRAALLSYRVRCDTARCGRSGTTTSRCRTTTPTRTTARSRSSSASSCARSFLQLTSSNIPLRLTCVACVGVWDRTCRRTEAPRERRQSLGPRLPPY